jgi:hypothetical protein
MIKHFRNILVGLIGIPAIVGGYFLMMIPFHKLGMILFAADHGVEKGKPYSYVNSDGWIIAGLWLPITIIILFLFWVAGDRLTALAHHFSR